MEVLEESMSRSRVEKLCKANETTKMVIGFLVYSFVGVGLGHGPATAGGLT